MASVWMVTTGSYSDYRVVGLWATRELAERVVALLGRRQEPDIEELNVQESLDGLRRAHSFRVPYQRRSGEPTVRETGGYPLDLQEPYLQEIRGDREREYWGTDRDAVRALARAFAVELHGVALER